MIAQPYRNFKMYKHIMRCETYCKVMITSLHPILSSELEQLCALYLFFFIVSFEVIVLHLAMHFRGSIMQEGRGVCVCGGDGVTVPSIHQVSIWKGGPIKKISIEKLLYRAWGTKWKCRKRWLAFFTDTNWMIKFGIPINTVCLKA